MLNRFGLFFVGCFLCVSLTLAVAHAQNDITLNDESAQTQQVPAFSQEEVLNFFDGNVADLAGTPTQSLPVQQNTQQQSREDVQDEIRSSAFDAALQSLLPLKPEEIRELLEHFDRTQESVELPVYPMPKPELAVQTLSLDPGTRPQVVRMAYGHVTTLNVLDTTGAPWPIEDISWAGNFDVVQSGGANGTHIIRITPQSEFAYGNMSMKLLTLKTPVILMMETNRDLVHYRFDAIIPEFGPFAEAPIIQSGITLTAGNPDMSSVLQGIIPQGAERLKVEGVDTRTSAYRLGGDLFVRTPFTLLSPSWSSSVASADGTRVYTVKDAPVLLLSDSGKMVRARLTEKEDFFDE